MTTTDNIPKRSMMMLTSKHRPAPFLVATFSFGENQLPTVRAAYDLGHATDIAKLEASVSCMPVVRVYTLEDLHVFTENVAACRLVTSLRI